MSEIKWPYQNWWISASASDTGKQRENNEDAVLCLDRSGCFVVSDGMGGGSAGEIASSTVVTYIRNAIAECPMTMEQRREAVSNAVYRAHEAIVDYADRHEYESMGATVVVLLLDPFAPDRAELFFAGDSRIYRMRGKNLECLTSDHTIANVSGIPEKKLPSYMAGLLSNVVGIKKGFFLASQSVDIQKDDVFLLCSDGLYRQIPDAKLLHAVLKGKNLKDVLSGWIDDANHAEGIDNLSAILVRFGNLPSGNQIKSVPDEYHEILDDSGENLQETVL